MQSDTAPSEVPDPDAGISRRRIIGGVGVAVAGGLAAGVAGAAPVSAATLAGGQVASGKPGDTVFEFICTIDQKAADFTGHGYLTAVAGLDPDTLFVGHGPRDQAHALFIVTANGKLDTRSVEGAVHTLDIHGELAIGRSTATGSAPSGGSSATTVASYDLRIQDILTVIMAPTGIPTLNGVATQLSAARVNGRPFGRPGMTSRFFATGLGTRSDGNPTLDKAEATLTVAGSMIAT